MGGKSFFDQLFKLSCTIRSSPNGAGHSRWPINRIDPMTSPSSHPRPYGVKCNFAYNFWWNRDRKASAAGSNVFLSPRRIDWYVRWPTSMWVITWSHVTLTWVQILTIFFRSKCIYFDVAWRDKHNGIRIISLPFLVQKLFGGKLLIYFDVSWSL